MSAWDWEEIGKELEEKCEHSSGIVLFTFWRLTITKCTWWCQGVQIEWLGSDGITRTLFVIKPKDIL